MCDPIIQCCSDTSSPVSVIPGAPSPGVETPNPSHASVQQVGDIFFIAEEPTVVETAPAPPIQLPMSLFRDTLRPATIDAAAFEPGRTYSMAESGQLLPAFVDTYVQMAVSAGTPFERLGFQVTRTVTPEGAMGPPSLQIMQMSGPTTEVPVPDAVAPGGGSGAGATAPEAPPPRPTVHSTTIQITAATGQIVAMLAIDNYLLRPLVEDGRMPNGARGPFLLLSVLLMNEALIRTRLIQRTTLGEMASGMVPFVGYQVMSMILLDYAGLEVGSQANEYGSILLAAGVTLGLHILGQAAQAIPRVAISATASRMTTGALAMQGVSVGGRMIGGVVGGVTIFDLLVGGARWAVGASISDERAAREYRLHELLNTIFNNESMGEWPSMFLGNIFTLGRDFAAMVSDDFESDVDERGDHLIAEMARDSNDFGHLVEDVIYNQILAQAGGAYQQHLANHVTTAADGTQQVDIQAAMTSFRAEIDWDAIDSHLSEYYGNNQEAIESQYGLLEDYIGGHARDAETIRRTISSEGGISNQSRLHRHLFTRARTRMQAAEQTMQEQASAWGLGTELEDGSFRMVRPDQLTPAQRIAYRTRILPQIMEIQRMQLIMGALGARAETS